MEAKWAAERESNASAGGSTYTAPGSVAEREFKKQSARSKSVVEGGDQSVVDSTVRSWVDDYQVAGGARLSPVGDEGNEP